MSQQPTQIKSRQDAEEIVALLSAEFGIKRPTVIWSVRCTRGRASYLRNAIKIGPRAWRGVCASLIHEFAHILAYQRNPHAMDGHHGETFKINLLHTVQAWYGDITEYPWATEYKSVSAYGRKKGGL